MISYYFFIVGENLELAVKREVLEETGIQTTFKCLLGFRHTHNHAFGCSDIYVIAYLSPNDNKIKKCDREISKCQWMKVILYYLHIFFYYDCLFLLTDKRLSKTFRSTRK